MTKYFQEDEILIDYEYHVYFNCWVKIGWMQFDWFLLCVYGGIFLYWIYLIMGYHWRTRTLFHKLIAVLPVLKIGYLLISIKEIEYCPISDTNRYFFLTLKIIPNLLLQSLISGCIILACLGFKIVRKDLTKPQIATVLTCMIMTYFSVFIYSFVHEFA